MPYKSLIVLLVATIGLKVLMTAPPPPSSETLLDRVALSFQKHGLVEAGRAQVTADGTYRASIFRTLNCPQAVAAIPLLRNAEITGLIEGGEEHSLYLVGGTAYSDFPTLPLWWESLRTRVGLHNSTLPPVVLIGLNRACIPAPEGLAS